jgi:hypothetical protein
MVEKGFKLEGFSFGWMLVVIPVGLFLSEVNWVGEFFQARCVLARPCFLPLGFRGDAAAPILVAFCWLLIA